MTENSRRIREWARVKDPALALWHLVDNWEYLGTDPYYQDFNDALQAMADRCAPKSKPRPTRKRGA